MQKKRETGVDTTAVTDNEMQEIRNLLVYAPSTRA